MSRPPNSSYKRKPKQERARELTEVVIEAAQRVFKSTDFTKATTNRIAQVAGVSIGSLYQYFSNKDSLISVIIQKRIRTQLSTLESLLNRSKEQSCEKVIHDIVEMIARESLSHKRLMKTIYLRGTVLEMAPEVLEGRERACRMIVDFLRDNHDPRLAQTRDLEFSIYCVINGILGAIFAAVLTTSREVDMDLLIDELTLLATNHLLKSAE